MPEIPKMPKRHFIGMQYEKKAKNIETGELAIG